MEWPKDDSTVAFEDITDPVCKAIKFAYSLRRKNVDKDIPWSGLDINLQQKACCLGADVLFKAETLAYVKEDQGYDALSQIIGHAVRLGIEQGMRIARSNTEYKTLVTKAELADLLLYKENHECS